MTQSTEPVTSGTSWAKQVVELYEQGCSDVEVAAELRITIKDFYAQIEKTQAFAQLVDYGRTLSQCFWEKQARLNLGNKQFNTSLWAFYMKNKFGWADKTETLAMGENTNTDLDALRVSVNKMVARHLQRYTPELTDAERVLTTQHQLMSDNESDL